MLQETKDLMGAEWTVLAALSPPFFSGVDNHVEHLPSNTRTGNRLGGGDGAPQASSSVFCSVKQLVRNAAQGNRLSTAPLVPTTYCR